MPTIATLGPYRFYFFSNEPGEPAQFLERWNAYFESL